MKLALAIWFNIALLRLCNCMRVIGNLPMSGETETQKPWKKAHQIHDEYLIATYTPVLFQYTNEQFNMDMTWEERESEMCYDNHYKCLMTHSIQPVCAFNYDQTQYSTVLPYIYRQYGYYTFTSVCDLHFDNCRRGVRFWRPLAPGRCNYISIGPYIKGTNTICVLGLCTHVPIPGMSLYSYIYAYYTDEY